MKSNSALLMRNIPPLTEELAARGFNVAPSTIAISEDQQSYVRIAGPSLVHRVDISAWRGTQELCVRIAVGSLFITRAFHEWLPGGDGTPPTPLGEPSTVLSAELVWLRWNADAQRADRHRYDFERNDNVVSSIVEDIDSVGKQYLDSLDEPREVGEFLLNLKHYPTCVSWGGKPLSAQPYLYSALMFVEAGDTDAAIAALATGDREYQNPPPTEPWQRTRLNDFRERKARLVEVLGIAAGRAVEQ